MIEKVYKYIIWFNLLLSASSIFAQEKVFVESLNFNTDESEYGPVFFQNGLVYCGVNVNSEVLTYVEEGTGKQLTDLFFVEIDSNSSVGRSSLFSKNLKTSFHDGPITFSADQRTAYFTRSWDVKRRLKNTLATKNRLGVFWSNFNGKEWSEPAPCPFNSEEYNVGQPALSADGNRIYVVSNKPGGFGGIDIYYSEYKEGGWGDLVNLGEAVNTVSNEMFPSVDVNDKLYFSSNRPGGAGGLDIYRADQFNQNWNVKRLRDTTLNSSADDFSIIWDKSGKSGYFSSNRNGSDDIYKITVVYPEFKDCEEIQEQYVCYEFYEEATRNVDSVAMVYEWNFGDGTKEQALEAYHCFENPGLYIVELNIMDPMISKDFITESTYEVEILDINQPSIICPDSVFQHEEFTVEVEQGEFRDYTIQSSYIDFGDDMTVKSKQEKHRYTTLGIKRLQVLIAGENAAGEIITNCFYKDIKVIEKAFESQTLSTQGESIIEELTKDTSEYGYYEIELLTSPTSLMGDQTVFKEYADGVREEYNEERQEYVYSTEKALKPFELIDKFREAHLKGFSEAQVVYHGVEDDSELLGIKVFNTESQESTMFLLKDILFAFDSDALTADSKKELDRLINFLKTNNNIKIEIEAHTDNIGSNIYNQRLSERRAKSVVNYLVRKRVKKQLLNAKGFGESKPIASNKTRKGRSKNRRATLKVLKL